MLTTFLAIFVLSASTVAVMLHMRSVVTDTISAITTSTARARAEGTLLQRAAFVGLWLLIFGLSAL